MHDKELPLLAGLAAIIRWCEALVNLLSGPCLTLALLVAIMDLAVHGSLLGQFPWLLIAWSACIAVGLDSQVIQAWDRVGVAFRKRRWGIVAGYVVIGLLLSWVSFIACAVFGLQHSLGLSAVQALAQMGVNPQAYQYERAALALLLVALSAINRYHPKQRTLAEKKADLTEQLELLPLQQQVQTLRATGAVQVARTVANAAIGGKPTKRPTPPKYPTGGGSPLAQAVETAETGTETVRLFPTAESEPKRRVARQKLTLREKVYRQLAANPDMTKGELSRKLRCSESIAGKYASEWRAIQAQGIAQ